MRQSTGAGDVTDIQARTQQDDPALEAKLADIANPPHGKLQWPARGVGDHHADGNGEQWRADQRDVARGGVSQGRDDEAEKDSAGQSQLRGWLWPGRGRHGNILLHPLDLAPPRPLGNPNGDPPA
jgi:hypothetical protein